MSKNLVIVLSDEEYKLVHQRAEKRGISASKYARDCSFQRRIILKANGMFYWIELRDIRLVQNLTCQ